MKTQLSSLDVNFLIRELSDLVGTRVDKIFQIGERDLKIDFRGRGEKREMIITPTYICLTKFKHKTPKTPSNMVMALRKRVCGGVVKEVRQHQFDRIIEIEVENRGTLVIELFSRGNVIWLDEKGVIQVILESQEWKDRILKPKLEYRYPPDAPNLTTLSSVEFSTIMSDKKEIVKIIASNLGLGASYANEVLERVGVDPDSLPDKKSVDQSYTTIKELLKSKIDARVVLDETAIDVVPFEMVSYKDYDKDKKASFNEAVDEYFTKIRDAGEKKEATKDYSEEVRRLERVIEKQKKTVEEMGVGMGEFKDYGDTIYANFQDIERVLVEIKEAKAKGTNWMEYCQERGIRVVDPAARKIEITGVGILIDKSVPDNATIYYDKSKKAKSKLEGAEKALKGSERELRLVNVRKVTAEKKLPEGPVERHKPEWYEKFRWFISSDGFLVIGGRDATTNEILIKKHLDANDLVFHSTVHGAPFFIIKNPESKEIPSNTKREAAEGAASYSSAWNAEWGSADVYAVKPDQVSKTAQSGEYLTKGAFMIRGEREWFKGTPLKLAMGFRVTEYAISIGGPETAVASQAKHYVKIGPGDMKSGQLAKEIKAKVLRETNKEDGQKIKKVILGEMQRWIPAGKGMLLK